MKIIQLHPTLYCEQNCTWCPYQGSHDDSEIPFAEIQRQLLRYRSSTNILKISGGGSPTLYRDFAELLKFARQVGYEIYLQTENSPLLDSLVREYCHDIRVSFGDGIPFSPPNISVDGFSYVISRSPEYDNLNELITYAEKKRMYVRVTQDDTDLENIPTIEQIMTHIKPPNPQPPNPPCPLIRGLGVGGSQGGINTIPAGTTEGNRLTGFGFNLRFWDALDYHHGKNPCPCYDSPLLTPLGWFPCCKTHVAQGLSAGYNETMNLGWEYPETPYDGSGCSRCYY